MVGNAKIEEYNLINASKNFQCYKIFSIKCNSSWAVLNNKNASNIEKLKNPTLQLENDFFFFFFLKM